MIGKKYLITVTNHPDDEKEFRKWYEQHRKLTAQEVAVGFRWYTDEEIRNILEQYNKICKELRAEWNADKHDTS